MMNSKSTQLALRLQEVILDGTWIANTNFKTELSSLSFHLINSREASKNSIALLAQHVHYYIKGISSVFDGQPLTIRDAFSFDFKPLLSSAEWSIFLATFWHDAAVLIKQIETYPEAQWNSPFFLEKYGSFERNIEGLIEHAYYHLGQIVLIKVQLAQPDEN